MSSLLDTFQLPRREFATRLIRQQSPLGVHRRIRRDACASDYKKLKFVLLCRGARLFLATALLSPAVMREGRLNYFSSPRALSRDPFWPSDKCISWTRKLVDPPWRVRALTPPFGSRRFRGARSRRRKKKKKKCAREEERERTHYVEGKGDPTCEPYINRF